MKNHQLFVRVCGLDFFDPIRPERDMAKDQEPMQDAKATRRASDLKQRRLANALRRNLVRRKGGKELEPERETIDPHGETNGG